MSSDASGVRDTVRVTVTRAQPTEPTEPAEPGGACGPAGAVPGEGGEACPDTSR